MVQKDKKEPNDRNIINQTLNFFRIKNESELDTILQETWNQAKCYKCGKIINLENCDYVNEEIPICRGGCK